MGHKAPVIDLASRRRVSRPRSPPSGLPSENMVPIRYAPISERIWMGAKIAPAGSAPTVCRPRAARRGGVGRDIIRPSPRSMALRLFAESRPSPLTHQIRGWASSTINPVPPNPRWLRAASGRRRPSRCLWEPPAAGGPFPGNDVFRPQVCRYRWQSPLPAGFNPAEQLRRPGLELWFRYLFPHGNASGHVGWSLS